MSEDTKTFFPSSFQPQIKEIAEEFADNFIMETIIDYFRINKGFPGAKPLNELQTTQNVVPKQEFVLPRKNEGEYVSCPYCQNSIPNKDYLTHLGTHKGNQEELFKVIRTLF